MIPIFYMMALSIRNDIQYTTTFETEREKEDEIQTNKGLSLIFFWYNIKE